MHYYIRFSMKQIFSIQNSFIKSLVQLQEKSKARKASGTFLIEGLREIELALKGNFILEYILFLPELISENEIKKLIINNTQIIEISRDVYAKLAYRDSTEGIIGVAKTKNLLLSDLILPKNALILVVEAIEKPGNLGAMLRTADAANVDAVIITDSKSDLYNPNTVRSSVGCVFTNQIATTSSANAISFLKENNFQIFCATLQNSTPYYLQNFQSATALVVGSEALGLSQEWRSNATQNIIIPMEGQIDSMNVSVAAAILIFEAKRQRNLQ